MRRKPLKSRMDITERGVEKLSVMANSELVNMP